MWRQTIGNLHSGYLLQVLPKYGTHWDYWSADSEEAFLMKMPDSLLLRQLSTFSPTHDIRRAAERIHNLDEYVRLDQEHRTFDDLFDTLDVALVEEAVPDNLNRSPRDEWIEPEIIDRVKPLVKPEYELLSLL